MRKKRIAIALVISGTCVVLAIFLPLLFGKRALTAHESALLESIYQSSVDLDAVRIKFGGPLTLVYPGITLGNTISFPKGAYDENDQNDQALLVHEVCHVWQYQHFGLGYIPRSLWELLSQRDTYVVHYDAAQTFREYDIEEQCEIAAEYYLTQDANYAPYIEEIQSK